MRFAANEGFMGCEAGPSAWRAPVRRTRREVSHGGITSTPRNARLQAPARDFLLNGGARISSRISRVLKFFRR